MLPTLPSPNPPSTSMSSATPAIGSLPAPSASAIASPMNTYASIVNSSTPSSISWTNDYLSILNLLGETLKDITAVKAKLRSLLYQTRTPDFVLTNIIYALNVLTLSENRIQRVSPNAITLSEETDEHSFIQFNKPLQILPILPTISEDSIQWVDIPLNEEETYKTALVTQPSSPISSAYSFDELKELISINADSLTAIAN